MLKNRGLRVTILKLDPYLNVDPGTMSPLEHGEVFVTMDGSETDLDLGHYERFLNQDFTILSNVTAGQIYNELLDKERMGSEFLGETVQVVPHLVSAVARRIKKLGESEDADVVIVEVAARSATWRRRRLSRRCVGCETWRDAKTRFQYILTLVPLLKPTNELKTKPTQHSVRALRALGIQPDAILCRLNDPTDSEEEAESLKDKISLHCGVPRDAIIYLPTLGNVYAVPGWLEKQGLAEVIMDRLGFERRDPVVPPVWKALADKPNDMERVSIAIVGKYTSLQDSYLSVVEALRHAELNQGIRIDLEWTPSELIEENGADRYLSKAQGIVVPGGFDKRGTEGMIQTAQYAREREIPYLGLCLGLQMMIIEFARHVAGIEEADSTEFDAAASEPVIALMEEQKNVTEIGGTMRLGAYSCVLTPGTRAYEAYAMAKNGSINERHRHRFEYNNAYRDRLERLGLLSSGMNPELSLVEIAEISDHPFMLGSQFHPEFRSRPEQPHPLFDLFVRYARQFRPDGTQHQLFASAVSVGS
ncbi:CTP synthase [Geodia barretti]|uniref:CTP synthase n=1 Tax=Geodia barretti TaxID=519541 RepID=A0AA35RUF0_GEOBA|nr:CTP synthase [Geodia barretti]